MLLHGVGAARAASRRPLITMRRIPRLLLLTVLGLLIAAGLLASPASAHNSLDTSTPAEGAVLSAAPTTISMVFDNEVPLETASAAVIDSTGARLDLAGLAHGPSGPRELVASLPALADGAVTVRWRLVGADGHPLTGRIGFTIDSPAVVTTVTAASAAGDVTPTTVAVDSATAPSDTGDGAFSTPDWTRWVLRYASYLAIAALIGIVLTDRLVWPGSARRPLLQRIVRLSLVATAVLAFVQFAVLASDISGKAPFTTWSGIDAALETHAGLALVVRIVLAVVVWLVLQQMAITHSDVRWAAVGIAGILLMGTWAWAGHSRSQRWADLGVPVDIVHHGAAALWIGSLAIVGIAGVRSLPAAEFTRTAQRLSRVAAVSVALIVGTGLVQAIRLVGGPGQLFEADHGRYLTLKVALLGVMLVVANLNRRRLAANTGTDLQRTIVVELVVGLAIIGVTAALVVSPPATAAALPLAVDNYIM